MIVLLNFCEDEEEDLQSNSSLAQSFVCSSLDDRHMKVFHNEKSARQDRLYNILSIQALQPARGS